jgi:hypothetical protein
MKKRKIGVFLLILLGAGVQIFGQTSLEQSVRELKRNGPSGYSISYMGPNGPGSTEYYLPEGTVVAKKAFSGAIIVGTWKNSPGGIAISWENSTYEDFIPRTATVPFDDLPNYVIGITLSSLWPATSIRHILKQIIE